MKAMRGAMPESTTPRHLIIHGHFYQPPRENPWTERIDRQAGAAPYHDWNVKIAAECYVPNTCSRRLDGYGRITRLVNNYEWISFNFGPTLLSWLEEKHPGTYQRILDADRLSSARTGGHGNAIAQAYNHIIMPLATVRDQETQIRWGVRDFERRFGRAPEGIWLPETAINGTTLKILIDFGFRFIILSPHQADRIRPLQKGGRWKSVQDGSIQAGSPYRCFDRDMKCRRDERRFIDVFFYDAPLSVDMSFNHLLRNGDTFADSILAAYQRNGGDLVTLATDGEVYGHHEPFADMALSYLIDTAAPARRLLLTNFGAYLDTHEPEWEVRLKAGDKDEGTAWSCAHGVGRWQEDCGCNVGAPPEWNQKWRNPLRRALDGLRDELSALFENEGGVLIGDPWTARNDYFAVIADRTVENTERFISEHASRAISPEERSRALALLESQRFALLMFTSCGWFFNDISGVESVQLLRYAARAIELAGAGHRERLEKSFLDELSAANSNVPDQGTGADIYTRAVEAVSTDMPFFAGQHAIFSHLLGADEISRTFAYTVRTIDRIERSAGENSVSAGCIEIISPYTLDRRIYRYAVAVEDGASVTCRVENIEEPAAFSGTAERFRGMPEERISADPSGIADELVSGRRIELRDLFIEDRERILLHICKDILETVTDRYDKLYEENRRFLGLLKEAAIKPPRSLSVPAQAVLTRKLVREVERWQHTLEPAGLDGIKGVVSEAEAHGVEIDTTAASLVFRDLVHETVMQFEERLDAGDADALLQFVELSHASGIGIEMHDIQNEIHHILETTVSAEIERLSRNPQEDPEARRAIEEFLKLARRFNFNTGPYEERLPQQALDVL